jgi:osmotically-inducible protein OsmY
LIVTWIERAGSVESGLERLDAEGFVGGVPGVAGVDNQLAVTRTPTDVKAAFEAYLYWDAMVRPNRVNISVAADGTATLTGRSIRGARPAPQPTTPCGQAPVGWST